MGLWCLICPSWSGFSRPLRSPGGPTDSWYAPTTLSPPSACPLSVPLAEIANKIPLIRWGTTVSIGLPLLQLSILNLYVNSFWSNLLQRFHENRIQLMGWVEHRVGSKRVFCVCVWILLVACYHMTLWWENYFGLPTWHTSVRRTLRDFMFSVDSRKVLSSSHITSHSKSDWGLRSISWNNSTICFFFDTNSTKRFSLKRSYICESLKVKEHVHWKFLPK